MGVRLESFAGEVDAVAAVVAEWAAEGVGVRPFEGDFVFPEACLSGANIVGADVRGAVVTDLGHEPRAAPLAILVGVGDELGQVFGIQFTGQSARLVFLVSVAFALVPKHRPEGGYRTHACHEHGIGLAVGFPSAVGGLAHAAHDGRGIGERDAGW
jgi:hypothetical protein